MEESQKDQTIASMEKYIQELQLFSDQIKFNAIVHQGLSMILEKITKIEEKLDAEKKTIQNKE